MAKYLQLPDGNALKVPDEMGYNEAMTLAQQKFPELFGNKPQAKTGLLADIGSSAENLLNIGRTGLAALTGDTTQAALAGAEREKALGEKYQPTFSTEKITKPFEEGQYGTAALEAVKGVPGAVAQIAPSVAQEAGLALAGRVAGGALGAITPVPGGAAIGQQVGQYALPLIVNAIQALGSQAQSKVQEQVKAGEKPDVSALELAPYAAANAAANLVGTRIAMPSIFKKAIGQKVEAEAEDVARAALMKEAEKIAGRGTLKTIGAGVGKFAVGELPTEIFQDVVDRAAIGKPLADDDAIAQYRSTALTMALASPLGGGVGVYERAGARQQVEKEKEAQAAKAAAEAEAAKNAPEALTKLDDQFRAAKQQLLALNEKLKVKPPKGDAMANEEFAKQKAERDAFAKDTFKPLAEEYAKRKTAIDQMYSTRMADLETQAAQGQLTAAAAIPNAGIAIPTTRLMEQYGKLRDELGDLESQLAAGPDIETQAKLREQHLALVNRMQGLAPKIQEQGGVTDTEQEYLAKLAALDKQRLDALSLGPGEFEKADKLAAQIKEMQTRLPMFEELRGWKATKPGETQALALPEPVVDEATAEAQKIQYQTPSGKQMELPGMAAVPGEATALPQPAGLEVMRQKQAQQAQTKLDEAKAELPTVLKSNDQPTIYKQIDTINKLENQAARLSEPFAKQTALDIFDPANILRNAIDNNDYKTVLEFTKARDESKAKALSERAEEKEALEKVLSDKLNVEGMERTLKNVDEIAASHEKLRNQIALLTSGSFPDKAAQARYDKSPDAYAYDYVMDLIGDLKKKVETRQGNAKRSWLEELTDIAQEHADLQQRLETGIAKPTMGEKVANIQAKLGKGEVRGERQMDAAERRQAEKRMAVLEQEYQRMLGKITPIKNEVVKLYNSLYNVRPVETVAKTEEKKRALSEAPAQTVAAKFQAARDALVAAKADKDSEAIAAAEKKLEQLTSMSREAKRQKNVEEGKISPESEKMTSLAYALGKETEAFAAALKEAGRRLEALKKRYGDTDAKVREYKLLTKDSLQEIAVKEGRKTAEFREAMKEQRKMLQEAASQSTQEQKSKREKEPMTRRAVNVKREEKTSVAPESREAGEAKTYKGKAAAKRVNNESGGTAYRLREGEAAQVVDAGEAQKVIDGLSLPDNVKFVYAPTPGQIPVRLLKQMQLEGVDPTEGMVQGAVFSDGTVLVVGDQHTDVKDLEETIAHELIGHYGVDTVVGTERLNEFAKKTDVIKLAEELGGKKLVGEVLATVRANADLGRSEEVQKLQALREIIAHTEEARVTEAFRDKARRFLKEFVGMVREGLRKIGLKNLADASVSDVYYMLRKARREFENKTIGPYRAADGEIAFRRRTESNDSVVGQKPSAVDTFLGNVMGLAGRVQFVDQYAAIETALKKGMSEGQISSLEATNANYLLRFGKQVSQFAGQFLTNGRVKLDLTKKPDGVESVYRSVKGTNLVDVAQTLSKAKLGNDTQQENMFTVYLAGQRAKQVGWDKLNFTNPSKAKAEFDSVMTQLNGNQQAKAAFEEAAKLYQQYNAGLLDFLVETGALTSKKANELKAITYVPFYRMKDGEVQLMIDKEHPVRIGNIKDEPQLQQLVGGDTSIMPVFTSAVQNTFMLTNMGLRNQAVKETAFTLRKLGIASRISEGSGPKGADVVRFKKNGKDHYAVIDTDMYGVPADLIVKGMEGIKTSLPAVIRLMGMPANLLRAFVVRNPTYAIRQVVRDPLNAWLTTGTDAVPVLSSMKELASMVAGRSEAERKLMESGAISSNVYSGDEQDMAKFIKDVSAGRSGWDKAMARLDAFAMQGDAATRAVVYKDSLAKGMTEQEALLRTLESMNFSRRGVSPSMQALSVLIPFFNAQIQGLDVLYRAFKGDMPYSEQLKIKEKMLARGMMMAMGTIAYAAMMEDDEAYKRAKPEERYGNWFVYIPGSKEPLRIPIPFELGYLFKALPEAVYNMAANDEKASKALGGVAKLVAQTNPFALPQAVKPLTEAILGKSFFSGDIESQREKQVLATQRYRDNSTEIAKLIGSVTGAVGLSPITIDYLIRGYTGGLGIAIVSLANPLLASDTRANVAKPSMKPSQMPFIGGLFQPVEGRGTLDEAYDRMMEIRQVKGTYNKLIEDGKRAEAQAFVQEYSGKLAAVSVSGAAQKQLGELAKQERVVKNSPSLTTEQKDAQLERLDKIKLQIARNLLKVSDKTTPQ
jgi:hypothetical protein